MPPTGESHRFHVVGRHPQSGEDASVIVLRTRTLAGAAILVLSVGTATWSRVVALTPEQAADLAAGVTAAAEGGR